MVQGMTRLPAPAEEVECAFAILGLPRTCQTPEIKRAFRAAALVLHPDKPGGDIESFQRVADAFDALCDPQQRAAHRALPIPTRPAKLRRLPGRPLKALGDEEAWVAGRCFDSRDEAEEFVLHCQPFDFEAGSDGTFAASGGRSCPRRWRIRERTRGFEEPYWAVEWCGNLFEREQSESSAFARARTAITVGVSESSCGTAPEPLYIGVPEANVARVLAEGYRVRLRRGVPCASTAEAAIAAAGSSATSTVHDKPSVGAATASDSANSDAPAVAALRVVRLPQGVDLVRRPGGGFLLTTGFLPGSCLRCCTTKTQTLQKGAALDTLRHASEDQRHNSTIPRFHDSTIQQICSRGMRELCPEPRAATAHPGARSRRGIRASAGPTPSEPWLRSPDDRPSTCRSYGTDAVGGSRSCTFPMASTATPGLRGVTAMKQPAMAATFPETPRCRANIHDDCAGTDAAGPSQKQEGKRSRPSTTTPRTRKTPAMLAKAAVVSVHRECD